MRAYPDSATTLLLGHEKSSQSLNPPQCPSCGEKMLKKKVFIVKTNVIRKHFLEIFEKEKMLKL